MTTTLLTFADESFADWQRVCTLTAQVFGIHAIHAVSPSDIDARFARDNHDILTQPRGCGLWLWKPYFIDRVLRELDEGDVLIYADAADDAFQLQVTYALSTHLPRKLVSTAAGALMVTSTSRELVASRAVSGWWWEDASC